MGNIDVFDLRVMRLVHNGVGRHTIESLLIELAKSIKAISMRTDFFLPLNCKPCIDFSL